MPYDFSFYNALKAGPDYKERRLDASNAVLFAEQLKKDAEAKQAQRQEDLGVLNDIYDSVQKQISEFTDKDAQAVVDAEKKLREPLVQAMKESGGDVHKFFLNNNGQRLLKEYETGLNTLPEFKQGLQNKINLVNGVSDIAAGKIPNYVDVDLEDGSSMRVKWDKALGLYDSGLINKIPYSGSFSRPDNDSLDFTRIEDPYKGKTNGFVPLKDVRDWLMLGNKLSEEQVNEVLGSYADPKNPTMSTFKWKPWEPQMSRSSSSGKNMFGFGDSDFADVKAVSDNLFKALYDPAVKTTYHPDLGAYEINMNFDVNNLKKGSGKSTTTADKVYVKNASDPNMSRFIVQYDDGTKEEKTLDDMAMTLLSTKGSNVTKYSTMMALINGDGSAIFNPNKYHQTVDGLIPYMNTQAKQKIRMIMKKGPMNIEFPTFETTYDKNFTPYSSQPSNNDPLGIF